MKMKKRTVVITASVVAVGLLAAGGAYAFHGFKGGLAQRIYEKVKKELALTQEQSHKVDGLRDRIVAHFQAKRGDRDALVREGRAIWLADQIDDAKVDALAAKVEQRHQALRQLVKSSVKELHALLTKPQREKLLQMIDQLRARMKARWKRHHEKP